MKKQVTAHRANLQSNPMQKVVEHLSPKAREVALCFVRSKGDETQFGQTICEHDWTVQELMIAIGELLYTGLLDEEQVSFCVDSVAHLHAWNRAWMSDNPDDEFAEYRALRQQHVDELLKQRTAATMVHIQEIDAIEDYFILAYGKTLTTEERMLASSCIKQFGFNLADMSAEIATDKYPDSLSAVKKMPGICYNKLHYEEV